MSLMSALRGAARGHTVNLCERCNWTKLPCFSPHSIPFVFLLSTQAEHYTPLCSQTVTQSIRLETGGVNQGLVGSQGRPPSDGSEHFWVTAPPEGRRACSAVVNVPACLPTCGSSVPAPSSRLQMKPLRNAHWCPLKHRLSPPYYSTSPPSKTRRQFDLGAGWRECCGRHASLCMYSQSPTNMHSLVEWRVVSSELKSF